MSPTTTTIPEQTKLLPLWAVIKEACLYPWGHRRHVGGLLIIPVCVSTIVQIFNILWLQSEDTSIATGLFIIFQLLYIAVLTFFAVSYHRSILIGKHAVSWFGVSGWSMRETRFFLWFIAIYLVAVVFMIPCEAMVWILIFSVGGMMGDTSVVSEYPTVGYILGLVSYIPFLYIVGRLSLLLPACAVDLQTTFSFNWAFSLSKGNGWRVALLIGGAPLVFTGLYLLIRWSLGGLPGLTGETKFMLDLRSVSGYFLQVFLSYAWLTIEVALLSITFRELSGWERNSTLCPQPEKSPSSEAMQNR